MNQRRGVEWRPRPVPLVARAVVGRGLVAGALVDRLLARAELSPLEGLAGPDLVIILGPEAELPWVDGVRYYGRDPAAPDLLLPTTRAPTLAPELYSRAIEGPRPLLIEPEWALAWPLEEALPLSRRALLAYRETR